MTIGQTITSLRNARNLSQIELSKILGIKNNTLSQYENGARSVPDDIKLKIATYFDVSLDFLMGRAKNKNASSEEDAGLSAEENELLELFRNASPALQDAALRVLEADQKKESS